MDPVIFEYEFFVGWTFLFMIRNILKLVPLFLTLKFFQEETCIFEYSY